MRNWLVLSMTMQPAAAARGACTAETAAPGLNRPMSQPVKSNLSRFCTVSTCLSPKLTCWPAERPEARAATSLTGKLALGEGFQHLAPDRPGGADDRDPVAHRTVLPLRAAPMAARAAHG